MAAAHEGFEGGGDGGVDFDGGNGGGGEFVCGGVAGDGAVF